MLAAVLAAVAVIAVSAAAGYAQEKTPDAQADIAFWSSVKDSKDPAEIKAYLDAFPKGTFAELAKIRLKALERAMAAPAPASPPKAPMETGSVRSTAAPAGTSPSNASVLTDAAVIREVQEKLYQLNYEIASRNGRMAEDTRRAIRSWQTNVNRPVTGDIDAAQLALLRSARIPATWGAMAYAARGASGVVWSRSSRDQAEREAIAECGKRGGGTCKVVTAAGTGCGALGFYTGQVGTAQHYGAYASVRPTLGQATDNALSECRRQAKKPEACGVRMTFCADGSHKR
jgi:peptidoglycan hydrolase-like protein with peptidoglycan-binding domain